MTAKPSQRKKQQRSTNRPDKKGTEIDAERGVRRVFALEALTAPTMQLIEEASSELSILGPIAQQPKKR